MRKMSAGVVLLALFVVSAAIATTAYADTVYLKNGRMIHSSLVIVEAERVVVRLYEGLVAFPIDIVDRVEENDKVEPGGYVPPAPEEPELLVEDAASAPEEGAAAPEEGAAQPEEGQAVEGQAQQADPDPQPADDPRQTQQYWQSRLRPLFNDLDRAESEREEYRRLARTSAEAQRQFDRLEDYIRGVNQQIEAIRAEARRNNVPAGWLRR